MMTGTNVGLSGRSRRQGAGGRQARAVKTQNSVLRAGSSRGWTAPAGGRHMAGSRGQQEQQAGRESRTAGRSSGRHDYPLSSAQIHLSGAGYGTNGNQ